MKCSIGSASNPARVLPLSVALLLAGLLLLSSPAKSQPERTLFDRLGGVYPIALTVNDLVDRLYLNKTLNANPRIKKVHESIGSRESAKVALTAWAVQYTGGPVLFPVQIGGVDDSLKITDGEFDVILDECGVSFNNAKFPQREVGELLQLVEGFRSQVVIQG